MNLRQYAVILPLYFLGGFAFALNVILPEYELWRAGSMTLTLAFGISLMLVFVNWHETRDNKRRQTRLEPFKVRFKRYQDKKYSLRREITQ